jgi:hypothetical protein
MKFKLLSIIGFSLLSISTKAQLETPQPSPLAKIEQKVGLTDIHITYSRPGMRDRKIYGDLVPFDKIWRTGANYVPVFKFTDEVEIAGEKVPAGEYSFLTIPGQNEWTLILNKTAKLGGTGAYKQEEDQVRWKVKAEPYPVKTETFTFTIANVRDNGATVEMIWENTRVAFDVKVFFEDKVMKRIDEILAGPSSRDYYQAARFYHENGKDLKKALEWINLSLAKDERYWVMTTKAKIQADMKDYKGAVVTATKAAELAKTAGNDDYVKMNNESIAKWSKMK